MKKIRILLADDHPALRVGLRVLLEQAPDIAVAGEAGNGREALAQSEALHPDVIVLDCQLPEMDGAAVANEIRRRGWPVRVLALSSYSDERYVRAMIDAGAMGYLLKDEAPERIIAAARAIAKGEGWFSPSIASKVAGLVRGETKTARAELTPREREVLRLVAAGQSNKEIAATLHLSEKTVEKYLSELFAKLNVASRVEAAVLAVKEGLA